jgi:hypothetical protein
MVSVFVRFGDVHGFPQVAPPRRLHQPWLWLVEVHSLDNRAGQVREGLTVDAWSDNLEQGPQPG